MPRTKKTSYDFEAIFIQNSFTGAYISYSQLHTCEYVCWSCTLWMPQTYAAFLILCTRHQEEPLCASISSVSYTKSDSWCTKHEANVQISSKQLIHTTMCSAHKKSNVTLSKPHRAQIFIYFCDLLIEILKSPVHDFPDIYSTKQKIRSDRDFEFAPKIWTQKFGRFSTLWSLQGWNTHLPTDQSIYKETNSYSHLLEIREILNTCIYTYIHIHIESPNRIWSTSRNSENMHIYIHTYIRIWSNFYILLSSRASMASEFSRPSMPYTFKLLLLLLSSSLPRAPTTSPTITTAGALIFWSFAMLPIVSRVPYTSRCCGVVARSHIPTGRVAG